MMLLSLVLFAQLPPIAPMSMPVPVPVPDYALPVRDFTVVEIPEGPILGCIHRPATVPYDKMTLDEATRHLFQLTLYSEANPAMVLEPVRWTSQVRGDDLITRETIADARRGGAFLDAEIRRHWALFSARAYEIRMFLHQPNEAELALRRTVDAWRALQGIMAQRGATLTKGQTLALDDINALVGIIESQL